MAEQDNEHILPTGHEDLITLSQAAQLSGLSQTSLQAYAVSGRLKARKLGSFWVTTRTDLQAYLDSRHQGKKLK